MSLVEIAGIIGVFAGMLISLGIIWTKGIRPAVQFLKRMDTIQESVKNLPEWCTSVDNSLKQLHPNGGHSLKDRVDQTHALVLAHLDEHARDQSGV